MSYLGLTQRGVSQWPPLTIIINIQRHRSVSRINRHTGDIICYNNFTYIESLSSATQTGHISSGLCVGAAQRPFVVWIIDRGFTTANARISHYSFAKSAQSIYACRCKQISMQWLVTSLFSPHRFTSVILKTDLAKLNDASRVVRDGRMPDECENNILEDCVM